MKLVIGCNYHTTWQRHKAMRFVLVEIKGGRARLATRSTKRQFWTNTADLVFIDTEANVEKAEILTSGERTFCTKTLRLI